VLLFTEGGVPGGLLGKIAAHRDAFTGLLEATNPGWINGDLPGHTDDELADLLGVNLAGPVWPIRPAVCAPRCG